MEDCSVTVNANRDIAVRFRSEDGDMHYLLIPRRMVARCAALLREDYPFLHNYATVDVDGGRRQSGTQSG